MDLYRFAVTRASRRWICAWVPIPRSSGSGADPPVALAPQPRVWAMPPATKVSALAPPLGIAGLRGTGYARYVQRLFSMFPTGRPGLALLLLRLSSAGALLFVGMAPYVLPAPWLTAAAVVLALGLCLGFMTPYCALLCSLIEIYAAVFPGPGDPYLLLLPVLNSLVVAMIGPGGYSLDSHIFGRQLLTLPSRRPRGLH